MKKRLITLLCFMALLLAFGSGCSDAFSSETIQNETVQEAAGSYYLFKTFDVQEYLKFLEDFDETKYEIVDISTSAIGKKANGSDEFYMVTYKVIAESD